MKPSASSTAGFSFSRLIFPVALLVIPGGGALRAQVCGIDGECRTTPGSPATSNWLNPIPWAKNLDQPPDAPSAPAAGDTCASATVVSSLPFADLDDTCAAGDDYDETCGVDGPGSPDVVYAYTAAADGCLNISLCSTSTEYDTKLVVYESATGDPGDCGPYQSGSFRACSDDAFICAVDQLQSIIDNLFVRAGFTYFIVVDGFGGECGQYDLSITDCGCTPFPPNDFCADVTPAVLADGVTVSFTGDNTCATNECSRLTAAGISAHTWEAFTVPAPVHMDVRLDYCGSSSVFETAWAFLFDGCPCEGANFLAQNDFDRGETCSDDNLALFFYGVPPGTYYYPVMRTTGGFSSSEGPYQINVTGTVVPPPVCGDNAVNQTGEVCDGTDDGSCPGECRADCTCPPFPKCGDGEINLTFEECDGTDDAACPGRCRSNCTCPPPVCGDNVVNQPGEECDGTNDSACPGRCRPDCTCAPITAIPALTHWGLIAVTLLLLTAARIRFGNKAASG